MIKCWSWNLNFDELYAMDYMNIILRVRVQGSNAFRVKNFDVIDPGEFLIKVHAKEFC